MEQPPADDPAAPFLTEALFLSRTMSAPAKDTLLLSKRERVFVLVNRSDAPEADAEFAGMKLRFALAGAAAWSGSLPSRQHLPEAVVIRAESGLRRSFASAAETRIALVRLLEERAPYADLLETEAALREDLTSRRAAFNRAKRTI